MFKITKVLLGSLFAYSTLLGAEATTHEAKHSVKKLIASFTATEDKNVSDANGFAHMFEDAKTSGIFKSMYASYNQKEQGVNDNYATAAGGTLKYELAALQGFNAGVAFTTSYDIPSATGDATQGKQNPELSSSNGDYTVLSESYLNYKSGGLNLRAGRQLIDTPLADSDDIRMVHNTFEAYMLDYKIQNFHFTLGDLQSWQGYDAGLDTSWSKTGEDGTLLVGAMYEDDMITSSVWYYDIAKDVGALYADLDFHYALEEDLKFHAGLQYLHEDEKNASGHAGDVYGAVAEVVYKKISIALAYNKSKRELGKEIFSGFGGGTMYTSMDTMIIESLTKGTDATALVAGAVYTLYKFNILYTHGDFSGDGEHIIEHDMGVEYTLNDSFSLAALYVKEDDAESSIKTANDWDRAQLMLKYDF